MPAVEPWVHIFTKKKNKQKKKTKKTPQYTVHYRGGAFILLPY